MDYNFPDMAGNDLPARLSVLAGNRWFGELPRAALDEFARAAHFRRYANGELVAARGVAPEGVALVVKGAIRSATLTADGREIVFSLVQAGSLWGLVAAMDGLGAVHDTRAHRRTEVLMIPRAPFLAVLEARPALYKHFAGILCYRLRKAYSAVDEFALVPLRQRLARQLCTLALAGADSEPGGKARDKADGSGANLRFTQAEIAVMLGAARPSVNRELRRMQDEGLIEVAYRGVKVRQYPRLLEICETQGIFAS